MSESFICSGRTEPAVAPGPDEWKTNRWVSTGDAVKWPVGFEHPRTCSYCGGAHPEDILALMKLGWEVQPTEKNYKRYLHPPGYAARLRDDTNSPVPPLKFYTWHLTLAQIDRYNAILTPRELP